MHVRGSRSLVSSFSLLSDMLYVAIFVGISVWVVRNVFRLMSFCLFVMIVRSEVVLSPKIISGNFDFALVFSIFLTIVVLLHLNLMLSKRLETSGPVILRDLYFPFFLQLDFVCAISETLGFLLCPVSPAIVWSAFFCL